MDVVSATGAGGKGGDGFEALAALDADFLGTGYSTSVELSFIAMALIAGYVAISTARYFLAGTSVLDTVADTLGLRDR